MVSVGGQKISGIGLMWNANELHGDIVDHFFSY